MNGKPSFDRLIARGAALAMMALLAIPPLANAQTQASFGKNTVGALQSSGLRADFKRGSRFTLSEPGTSQSVCAYLDGNGGGTGTQEFSYVIYADAGGVPTDKVFETETLRVDQGASPSWRCWDLNPRPMAAGDYWIMVHTGSNPGVIRYYYDNAPNWYGNADTFSDRASTAFGSGTSGNGTISAYFNYFPTSELRQFGRTTLGTTPSAGLRAHFKRGSSFTLTEPGRLTRLHAYLDTLGGNGGNQDVSVVLYRDVSGRPTELLTGWSGQLAQWEGAAWWHSRVEPVVLSPGKYWIVIHTGETGGMLRYFADGTGNWYGNQDNYYDGSSPQFGAGTTGNGTISAYASYEPGNFVTHRAGRTDAATAPMNALPSGVITGSKFAVPSQGAALTALYAYVDGNGGGSGSQSVRMLVYDASEYRFLLIESEPVTIPAGMGPRWVRFPIRPAKVDLGNYWFMLQSGPTGGIVRMYGDGAPNQLSRNYVWPHAPGEFNYDGTAVSGNVTLSVYAEYSARAN